MASCSISSCEKDAVARGWCPKHWWRWRHYGDPERQTVHDLSIEERFWRYVDKSSKCWLWTGARRGDGYGAFALPGPKQIGAHRFSYELHYGEIPKWMAVMHSCDTPLCVNPDHLSVGTFGENAADSARKGRRPRGEDNRNAKLTEVQVRALRKSYAAGGITQKELARDYGISHALVSHVVTRKAWKHI